MNLNNVKCYVDDVVIHSATAESHIKYLENVFALLLMHGLRIRLKRCSFMQSRVELLGYCIDKEGIHTDGRKVQTIRDFQPPSSRKQLRYSLGIASYYRRFIKNFAKIARPMSEKTSEKVEFGWTPSMQKSFDTLKKALTTVPVLAFPDFNRPFLVASGSSSAAVGAVLSQLDKNGRQFQMYYASRSLNEVDKNHSTYEREGLAILFALKKFRITSCARSSNCSRIMKLRIMSSITETYMEQSQGG